MRFLGSNLYPTHLMILDSFKNCYLTDIMVSALNEANTEFDWFFTFNTGNIRVGCPWRVLKNGKKHLGIGDHEQIYGLPEKIDATNELKELFKNKKVKKFEISDHTGDIQVFFDDHLILQTFNFFSYEPWSIRSPDGTNYIYNDQIHMWKS